jgi:hypothetical protein
MQNILTQLDAPSLSRLRRWSGILLSALSLLFLTFDAVIKLLEIQPVVTAFAHLGYPQHLARGIGLLELACVVLHVLPRTAGLGALLLSGFLGGAISTHLRVGDPLFSHCLFPSYVGLALWAGWFLRDERARALLAGPKV